MRVFRRRESRVTRMSDKKLRVLLAEANPGEAAAALRAIYPEGKSSLELTNVSSVSTLLATLEIINPEVIFLDLSLTHPEPLDSVRRIHRSAPEVPLVVLADPANKDCAVRSLGQGALDYLLKGFIDPKTLERVLRAALERNTLDGLADLLRDPLTGLYIKEGFLTLGERAMETAKRRDSTLVLLCMRVENLSTLGSRFGHSAVEGALREVAALMCSSFRRTDIVARIGESQFAALAVDAVEPSAPVLCQRLEKRIEILNGEASPWGPLELRKRARFWSSKEDITFPELLDTVESGLRSSPDGIGARTGKQWMVSPRAVDG
jgi:two-component system, cell cycle response regulator